MTTQAEPPVLRLTGVNAGYGTTAVLRHVSFSVRAGEAVAVLGANGAGKTTLLRVASGLITATSGAVFLGGAEATGQPPHWRARHGLCHVPEGRGIFRSLTVGENLRLQAPRSRRAGVIDDAVSIFPQLAGRLRATAGNLSGGQQQMLALARAFVAEPAVILIDELSMGLAPIVVDEMFAALTRLVAQGIATVIVEQHASRALAIADSAVLLRRGEVSYAGPAAAVGDDRLLRDYLGRPA